MITSDNITELIECRVWQKIESLMLEQEYTYEDLANKIGVSLRQIQRCEQETTPEMLYAITKVLSVYVTDLLPKSIECKGKNSELLIEILSWIRKVRRIRNLELRKVFYLLLKSTLVGKKNDSVIEKIRTAEGLPDTDASFDVICQKIGLSTDGHDNIEEEIDSIYYQVMQMIKDYDDIEDSEIEISLMNMFFQLRYGK